MDRVGQRLGKGKTSEADEALLESFLQTHDVALATVVETIQDIERLEAVHLAPTSRVKTRATLAEKIERERTRLTSVYDIAGVRIVVGETRDEQDRVRDLLVSRFPAARVVDRRATPNHGYRAVHIVVQAHGCQVEVQIRTRLQHLWAEVFEVLADRAGRQIRYGGEPDQAYWREAVDVMKDASELIARVEALRERYDLLRGPGEAIDRGKGPGGGRSGRGFVPPRLDAIRRRLDEVDLLLAGQLRRIRGILEQA